MKKNLTLLSKNRFDGTVYYADCPISKIFVQISGKMTLTPKNIDLVRQLGYDVHVHGVLNHVLPAFNAKDKIDG